MGRIRRAAHEQAKAEYGPEKARVRRETHSQVRSIRSEEPALIAAIELAQKQLRHSGLRGRDLAMAESELAHRIVDVSSSTALQIGTARRDAQSQLVDLSQGQSQAERSILSTLQSEAADRRAQEQREEHNDVRDFQMSILQKQAEKALGLTGESNGGLTPTQQRAAHADHLNAAHYAKEYVAAARHGLADEKTGKQILPAGPHNWNDQQWNLFVDKVSKVAGVDIPVAQKAVQAVRDHYQPNGSGTSSILHSLGVLAGVAAPAVAPKALQPVAQFAGLLGR